jgi:molybdopterin-containing oxidoreductase family iron-sulfur binding subunit
MKTIPPPCPEPESGRKYWQSLDQLADTPEFRQWMEREFPEGAAEWTDPVSRRHFVKIMSASFLLAGFGLAGAGCRRPVERLMPFGKAPEDYTFGTSQFYATAMPTRGGAVPLLAKSYEGRPIKVEGNPLYPDGNGGTDRYAQASILDLYDPDRAKRFAKNGDKVAPDVALAALDKLSSDLQQNGGQGLAFLIEPGTSPSRQRLQKQLSEKLPKARWFEYEPIDHGVHERAATLAFGQPVRPVFQYDAARVILSLDCDFIGSEEDAHNNIRRFAKGRRLKKPTDSMSRLYSVESLFTLTGVNADHRLRLPASAVAQVAAAIGAEVARLTGGEAGVFASVAKPAGVDPKWIAECAKDLAANRGVSLVVAGYRQPMAVHLIAQAINDALGNVGKTVVLLAAPKTNAGTLPDLAKALNGSEIQTLILVGTNPVYDAPADLNWAAAQAKAKTVVRLGYYEDETAALCHWHFPMAQYLESWGDARTSNGTLVPVQPLIQPLFAGLSELEFLARLGGETQADAYSISRETFRLEAKPANLEEEWKKFLHDGYRAGTEATPVAAKFNPGALTQTLSATKVTVPTKDNLEVVFYRDYKLDDGRYANNGWLQELPDPVTKTTWDNTVLISRKTARDLGVQNGDVVGITLNGRSVEGPIWTQPGQADYTLGLALGYGRQRTGRVGLGVGFNAYTLRTSATGFIAAGATYRKTGQTWPIACTQDHWAMEGRPVVREANLNQYRERPDFVNAMKLEQPPVVKPLYDNPLDKEKQKGLHQWGMSVDLNACVGCGTCILACQSENNVPIVGKDQIRRGRDMHWMRIDRYYASTPGNRPADLFRTDKDEQFEEWIDDPQSVVQPMFCQHCESAPCESVCPVNATVHDQEGLNVMVYNRCVGTRYCSNNCPYKVRRFNYLDFNKRSLKDLRGPFYPTPLIHKTDGKWDMTRWWENQEAGMRPSDETDLVKMISNPDVSVRMRGVMEKCTFCVQRIEQAKIAQKVKARASSDIKLKESEGTIPKTACQEACPAEALVFGDISDPESRVSRLKQQQRDYSVLEFLLTKPRTTYLARVRNPNPAMPDYHEPWSFKEYEEKQLVKEESAGAKEAQGGAEGKGARP